MRPLFLIHLRRKANEDGCWEAVAKPIRSSLGVAIAQYREYSKAHHRFFSTYIENGLAVLEGALGSGTPLKNVTAPDIERSKLQRLEKDKASKSRGQKRGRPVTSTHNLKPHPPLNTQTKGGQDD